jgi:hypothetical protein
LFYENNSRGLLNNQGVSIEKMGYFWGISEKCNKLHYPHGAAPSPAWAECTGVLIWSAGIFVLSSIEKVG